MDSVIISRDKRELSISFGHGPRDRVAAEMKCLVQKMAKMVEPSVCAHASGRTSESGAPELMFVLSV